MITTITAACGGFLAGWVARSLLNIWFFDDYQHRIGSPPLKLRRSGDPGTVRPTTPKPDIIPKPQPSGGRLIRGDQMPPCPDTIAAVRAADAAICDQALEAEFRAWWRSQGWPAGPGLHAVQTHLAWARHLLSRGVGA